MRSPNPALLSCQNGRRRPSIPLSAPRGFTAHARPLNAKSLLLLATSQAPQQVPITLTPTQSWPLLWRMHAMPSSVPSSLCMHQPISCSSKCSQLPVKASLSSLRSLGCWYMALFIGFQVHGAEQLADPPLPLPDLQQLLPASFSQQLDWTCHSTAAIVRLLATVACCLLAPLDAVQHLCDLVHGEEHGGVGRNGAQQAGRKALVEALDAALSPQRLRELRCWDARGRRSAHGTAPERRGGQLTKRQTPAACMG